MEDRDYYPQAARPEPMKEDGSLARFDHELGRLDELLDQLRGQIAPVLADRPEASLDTPHPAPLSQIAGRIDRLRGANGRLQAIIRDIDL